MEKSEQRGENDVDVDVDVDVNADAAAPEYSTIKYPGWKAMPYVIGNETFEKLGTMGTLTNQLVYLTTVFHLKSVTAATIMNIFSGTASMVPLVGAFISDNYIGRFATISVASMASLLGMVLLALTAGLPKLHPAPCKNHQVCDDPTPPQRVVLVSAYCLLIIGAGGIRPCNLAFGADQFDPRTKSGRRGIDSFFNWYYCTFTFAVMVSATVIVYVQADVSWALGLAIPACLMIMSCVAFFAGTKSYVRVKPEGSPFTGFAQVIVAAFKKRRAEMPKLTEELFDPPHRSILVTKLQHTDQFKFLDKAAVVTSKDEIKPNGEPTDPWRLCTVQQVEVVKCFVRMIPVWSTCVLFYIPLTQHSTYTVYQALQMDRRVGKSGFQIPAGSFVVFNMLTLTLWIPIYDRLIVPQLRKITKHEGGISVLQRMGIGIGISMLGMIVSSVVEQRRKETALRKPTIGLASGGGAVSSMSSLWLIPQLTLFGLCEAFNMIGQTEFFYHQFPENMRSVGMSVFCLGQAVSNYVSGALVNIIHRATGRNGGKNWLAQDLNDARLDLYYIMTAGIAAINLMYFIFCARLYRSTSAAIGTRPGPETNPTEKNQEKDHSV